MSTLPSAFRISSVDYGEFYNCHLLEIYKLFVESAENISKRRQNANSFFLLLNSTLVTFSSYVNSGDLIISCFLIPIIGVVLSSVWYRLLRSYRDLNSAKFKVIHEIEQNLPLAVYETEWHFLSQGKDSKKYLSFSSMEVLVPWLFSSIYLMTAIFRVLEISGL